MTTDDTKPIRNLKELTHIVSTLTEDGVEELLPTARNIAVREGRCLCGCGEETTFRKHTDGMRHSVFLRGHDQKLRSLGLAVSRGDLALRVLSARQRLWCERWDVLDS